MQKNLRGVIGTVSELMSVPDGYELAIETALGGAMQNIVCEDDRSANSRVEWLKSAGREEPHSFRLRRFTAVRYRRERRSTWMDICIAAESASDFEFMVYIYGYSAGAAGNPADNMDRAVVISESAGRLNRPGRRGSSGANITGGRYRNKSAESSERKKENCR